MIRSNSPKSKNIEIILPGVSAIKQVLSLKLPTYHHTPEQIVEKINEHLVEQIRVIGLKRVTKNFNSKNNADARTYLYVCPTLAFTPPGEAVKEAYRLPAEKVDEINRLLAVRIIGATTSLGFSQSTFSGGGGGFSTKSSEILSLTFLVNWFESLRRVIVTI